MDKRNFEYSFVDYEQALKTRRENPNSSWSDARSRLRPEAWPVTAPSFKMHGGAKIFTIGSCFARNIEEHLLRLGFQLPTTDFVVPKTEYPYLRTNGILNKFTPPSISQIIDWAANILRRDGIPTEKDSEEYAYRLANGTIIDNNLGIATPVDANRFVERRKELYALYKQAFSSDVIVLTPGLVEAWYDEERGIFVDGLLTRKAPSITKNLRFIQLDYPACYYHLDRTVGTLREFNPDVKILITASPVPLAATFAPDDIIIANTYAKATLRAACGDLARKWPAVDYYPSYESVALTRDWGILEADLIHVSDGFVSKIVSRMVSQYVEMPLQANEINQGDSLAAERLYQMSVEVDEVDTAVEYARKAIACAPDVADYHARLGALLVRNVSQIDEAVSALFRALELAPERLGPCYHLFDAAKKYEDDGKSEIAMRVLLRIAQAVPSWAMVHERLGALQSRIGGIAAGEAELFKSYRLDPARPSTVCRLIVILRRARRLDEGLEIALHWLRQFDERGDVLLQLGLLYNDMGDKALAESTLRKALAVAKGNPSLAKRIANVLSRIEGGSSGSILAISD